MAAVELKYMKIKSILQSVLLMTLLALLTLFVSGCQEDILEITTPPPEEAITIDSNVASLLKRTSLKDGSADNIIDHSSCMSVNLPVSVVVNGVALTITTEDDFVEIEKILDSSDDDVDVFEIVFPITVILPDFSEEVVENEEQLTELAKDCIENGLDDDIECLDFKYPLSFSIFNSQNQVADVISINNDEELQKFFDDLEEFEIVSLNFPLTVILYDGTEIIINDNIELESTIENVADECDEDDDNDFDEDDVDDSEFIEILTEGVWEISYFFDKEDNTSGFEGYIFKFFHEGLVLVNNGSNTTSGEWDSSGDGGLIQVKFDFNSNDPFNSIDQEWDVVEFDADSIQLRDDDDQDGSSELLTLQRAEGGESIFTVREVIVAGTWEVASFVSDESDQTSEYRGYVFYFSVDGTLVVTNDANQSNGTWSESFDGDKHILSFDFGSEAPLYEFNDDWKVIQFSELVVQLGDTNDSPQSEDSLVFKKIQ